jgi:NADH:ubiquinone oxidoreductase subunit 3 (subunit A)
MWFDPFGDARNPFHIRFYLLSILFIIFDIEVVFFFPWIMSLSSTLVLGFMR